MSILRPTGTLGKQSTGNAVNQKIAAVTLAIAGAFNSVEAAPVSHTFLGGTVDPIILAQ